MPTELKESRRTKEPNKAGKEVNRRRENTDCEVERHLVSREAQKDDGNARRGPPRAAVAVG